MGGLNSKTSKTPIRIKNKKSTSLSVDVAAPKSTPAPETFSPTPIPKTDANLADLQAKLPQLLFSIEVRTDDIEFEENDQLSQVSQHKCPTKCSVCPRNMHFGTFKPQCKRSVSCAESEQVLV
jgi:hypothetical protein